MKRKVLPIIIILVFGIFIYNVSKVKTNQLSTKQKIEDFEYLYDVIKNGYPYLNVNKRRNNVDWIENKDKYIKRIKNTKNDEEFIEEISSIVSELGNKHTQLIDNKNRYKLFKKAYAKNNWYDFLDDKKVVDRYNSIKPKIKITKDDFSKKELILEDVVKDKVGYMYLPSMPSSKVCKEKALNYINNLDDYEALIIDIRGNGGGSDSYWQSIVSKLINNDIKIHGYRVYMNNSEIIKKYTDVRNLKLESIENLKLNKEKAPKEVFKKFSNFERINYTIKPKNNLNFKGSIYLLIDENVYSSAETFSMFCKETKFATLIGQTTGGDGGGLDPVLFKLKNSGLIVRMASSMYLNKDGICDEEFKTTPDFKIKRCKRTKSFKHDMCIKKVLKLKNIN